MSMSIEDIDYAQRIGGNIERLLTERHMSQAELARRLDVSRSGINKYVMGISAPSPRNIMRIASALGVTADELLMRTELSSPDETYDPMDYINRMSGKLTGEQILSLAGIVREFVRANGSKDQD